VGKGNEKRLFVQMLQGIGHFSHALWSRLAMDASATDWADFSARIASFFLNTPTSLSNLVKTTCLFENRRSVANPCLSASQTAACTLSPVHNRRREAVRHTRVPSL